jgi:hypothetical protein
MGSQRAAGRARSLALLLFPPKIRLWLSTLSFDRNRLFAGLCVIGFIDGNFARVVNELRAREVSDLFVNTLDISVIVWAALFVGVAYVEGLPRAPVSRLDGAVALSAAVAFLAPVAPLSWIALTGLAVYLIRISEPGSHPHRGGWILLALTIPSFWSRVLFSVVSDYYLAFDATLVGWILGTERTGNAIAFSDGTGYLWIAPACSSLANVSVAILCWVIFTQTFYRRRPLRHALWAVAASAAVIAINVARLTLIGMYSQQFGLLHGSVGATAANWLTFAAVIGCSAFGVRHDLSVRHRRSSRTSLGPQPSPQDPG